ncbi:hypothetical protein SAMN04487857_109106 [Pseudomonas sp. ok272]|nr:hypothetical protein SAMN04487857_109106 [Pseudomonas sp. ok272]SFN00290.1 hypothetical protein SAMN04487858_110113 [Pseudomonas sp. ok602]
MTVSKVLVTEASGYIGEALVFGQLVGKELKPIAAVRALPGYMGYILGFRRPHPHSMMFS